jgi:hypothetical protein
LATSDDKIEVEGKITEAPDRVKVELTPYDLTRGRIRYRNT